MKNFLRGLAAAVFLALLLQSPSAADVLHGRVDAVGLPADGSGVSKVALRFDLSSLRQGRGLTIQSAILEWELPEMPGERMTVFEAHSLTGSWGLLGPDALKVAESLALAPEATWEVFPQDHLNRPGIPGGSIS